MTRANGNGRQAAVAFILVTLFIDILGIGIVIPVLPELVKELVGRDPWTRWYLNPVTSSIQSNSGRHSATLRSSGERLFAARYLRWRDRFGLRADAVFVRTGPGCIVGSLRSPSSVVDFAVRFGRRLCHPRTCPEHLVVVRRPIDRRDFWCQLFDRQCVHRGCFDRRQSSSQFRSSSGMMFGLGFSIGPAIGGLLGDISLRLPFFVAAGLALLNCGYGYFVLPESLPPEKRSNEFHLRKMHPLATLGRLRSVSNRLGTGDGVGLQVACRSEAWKTPGCCMPAIATVGTRLPMGWCWVWSASARSWSKEEWFGR